ncbi:unnamed protein product [Paramecium sonneborni]|uniref:Dynein regulatory complex protein 1 n=1 Tax=Paramecium sonneborni TaxID=65129 RepID=A0A8S1M1J4_9CILI|nr:unnamed protein product [Paramecium sonneborni]
MDSKKTAKGSEQVQKSRGNIDMLIRTKKEELFTIKQKNDQKQKETRAQEEFKRAERANKIEDESKKANSKNAELEQEWCNLQEKDECEELNKLINQQKDKFAQIMHAKDELIKQFLDELNKKDDDFGKMIKEQAIDIQTLIQKMRSQFFQLRECIHEDLEAIENEYIEERANLLNNYQTEIRNLFDKRTEKEKSFVDERERKEEEYTKDIEKLRIQGLKSYAELKISMETEIQNLEKCYEDMKALYQLNTEKLDYNLKVLKEKQISHTHTHDDLKRKDQNLNNRLRSLIKDYNEFDTKFKQTNKELTQEYKRITRQFKELQRKFKHFDKADQKAYADIHSMNELEVRKLKAKILKCDKTIHIQQLGVDWEEPQDQKETQEKSQIMAEEEVQLPLSEDKLQEIVEILIEEVDFLIDDKMRETLEKAEQQEITSVKLGVIKKCLNIDSIDEMLIFIDELIKNCELKVQEEQPQQEAVTEAIKKVQIEQPQPVPDEAPKINYESFILNQNSIINFLMHWMKTNEQRKKQIEKMSSRRAAKQETERQKKERIAKEGKKYWEKLTQVLPEKTFRVWRILDKQLSKYYELLLKRSKLVEETGQIHNHNEELKNLLNQYLQINHELKIPPTRFLKLEQQQDSVKLQNSK